MAAARRHHAVAQHLPVTFVIVAEQAGGDVVAAAVALAAAGSICTFTVLFLPVRATSSSRQAMGTTLSWSPAASCRR